MPRPSSPQPICACSALQCEAGFPVRQEPLLLGTLPASPWHMPVPRGDRLGAPWWSPRRRGTGSASAINPDGLFLPPPWQLPLPSASLCTFHSSTSSTSRVPSTEGGIGGGIQHLPFQERPSKSAREFPFPFPGFLLG